MIVAVFAAFGSSSDGAAAAAADTYTLPLELVVPFAPTPVAGAGRSHLAYELHITNFGEDALRIASLEVLEHGKPLARYGGAELGSLLHRVGARKAIDTTLVKPGLRVIAILWVTPETGLATPIELRHRLVMADGQRIEGGAVRTATLPAVNLGPPLRGEWIAFGGAGAKSYHGQFPPVAVDGVVRHPDRFSIDWFQSSTDASRFAGDEADTRQAYGADLLAVADAVVAAVRDGIPENEFGHWPHYPRGATSTMDLTAGNYVMLDLGQGRFAFYAHVKPGSLRVRVGDRVRRGQVLGALGLSGNTAYPHLHFQVNAEASPDSEALPYQFDDFEMPGEAGQGWVRHRNELPMTPSGDPPRVRFAN